jgi:putative toxin-antitoxin system antitoxin component (TIGR02293 family)
VVPKKPTRKPSGPTAEDKAVVIFIDGNYFIYSVAKGLQRSKGKEDEHTQSKIEIGFAMTEHQKDLMVHAFDALNAVTLSAPFRIGESPVRAHNKILSRIPSNRTNETATEKMIRRAAEVLGSREEGMRWLGTPVRGLDFATPISLLGTLEGVERVHHILGQIEHGVW